MDELSVYKDYVEIVDGALHAFLTKFSGLPHYYDFLLYHFGFKDLRPNGASNGAGRLIGKRLRPIMCILIYRALTGEYERVLPMVVSVEILHNASLIHDDIQDHDELRWGRPTVWKLAGLEQGINFGDTLQALAYDSILDLSKNGFDDAMITRILSTSNKTHITVVEGQYMDLLYEKRMDISEYEYFEMISRKTAVPYAGVAECAAVLATRGENPALIEAYRTFAMKFGMLFQLTDDILGIWGDVSKTGKIPADIRNKKKTLPVIFAFSRASETGKRKLHDLYASATPIEEEASAVLEILHEAGAKELCREWSRKFYEEAMESLKSSEISNVFQEKLSRMAEYCFNRTSEPAPK